jgi:hypothetical protein
MVTASCSAAWDIAVEVHFGFFCSWGEDSVTHGRLRTGEGQSVPGGHMPLFRQEPSS